jgi:hypothetical protein
MKGSAAYVECFNMIKAEKMPDNVEQIFIDKADEFEAGESLEDLIDAARKRLKREGRL